VGEKRDLTDISRDIRHKPGQPVLRRERISFAVWNLTGYAGNIGTICHRT
jgi:hypothetical protein